MSVSNYWHGRKFNIGRLSAILGATLMFSGIASLGQNVATEPLNLPVVAPALDCTALASADLSQIAGASIKITSAAVVGAGKPTAYCAVQAVADGMARFEVHLPLSAWTQRFLVGNGAANPAQTAAFATMSRSDIGHRGDEDAFANNYQLRIDFAYRIMHVQVLASKALIAKFYHQPVKFSYYNACSEPGREGMMEVQRFPEDFDGAVTGCPPINDTINNGLFEAWNIRTNTRADGRLIISNDKLPLLHKAVLDECDALDSATDGIVSDPFACHPKLNKIECQPGQDASTCLTSEQIHTALELYRGAHDGKGGKLEPFGVLPGSELQWSAVIAPNPPTPGWPAFATDREGTVKALRSEFTDPALGTNWQLSDLTFDRASFDTFTKMHYLYDATDPDLSAFYKAGHKLIIWQGLYDNNVLPAHTILYYTALQQTMGAKAVDQFVRLYLLPGVGHCSGGDGPSIRDFLSPLMAWVERGVAPGALPGAHSPQPARGPGRMPGPGGPEGPAGPGGPGGPEGQAGPGGPEGQGGMGGFMGGMGGFMGQGAQQSSAPPDLTRPIYPYPYIAHYIGKGDVRDAANFVQGPARPAPAEIFHWFGADFYKTGNVRWCTATGPTTLDCKSTR